MVDLAHHDQVVDDLLPDLAQDDDLDEVVGDQADDDLVDLQHHSLHSTVHQ